MVLIPDISAAVASENKNYVNDKDHPYAEIRDWAITGIIKTKNPEEQKSYKFIRNFCGFSGNHVEKSTPLFPRLDIAIETEYINSLTK